MSVITLPAAVAAACGEFRYGQLRYDAEDVSAATGAAFTSVYGVPRWSAAIGSPQYLTLAEAGAWEALVLKLRGRINHLALYDLLRPRPQGNLTGATTLLSSAALGATSIVLDGARAGSNLITRARVEQTYDHTGWTATLVSLTSGQADPAGGTAAFLVSSTGAGNTSLTRTYTTTIHANRNARWRVWMKAGTLSGSVSLRVRDGALAVLGSQNVTITGTWTEFIIGANCGAAPAANLSLEINPVLDAAGAGETFYVYQPTFELSAYTVTNAYVLEDSVAGPQSGIPASQLVRVATGDHSLQQFYTTTGHAGRTYTFSCWLRAGTLTGNVVISFGDGAADIASSTVTPTSTWTRYSVTGTFGASPAANIRAFLNPANNAGSAGDTLEYFGLLLEEAATPGTFERYATLNPGDWLQLGTGVGTSQLVKVVDAFTGDRAGQGTVTFEPPLRYAFSAAAAVTWDKPVAYYKQAGSASQWNAMPAGPAMQGFALDLVEQWA